MESQTDKKVVSKFYVGSNTLGWCVAALEQAEALMGYIKMPVIDNSYGQHVMRSHTKEDFLVYSLAQILDWGELIQGEVRRLDEFIEDYRNRRDTKNIRDMRVHSAAYYVEKGRRQKEFCKNNGDASSTNFSNEGGYIIGERLHLERLINDVSPLVKDLRGFIDRVTKD